MQDCLGTLLGFSRKGLHPGNSPVKGKPAWLVTPWWVVIQVRGYDGLMNDAGASLLWTHIRSKRVSTMNPYF